MPPLVDCYIGRMKTRYFSLLLFLSMATLAAAAQSPSPAARKSPSIVGTWVLTAAYKIRPDGMHASDYGDHPQGLVIFTSDGHYSVQIYRATRLKFSSGDKFKGTAEEYKQACLSTSVHFGTYTLDPVNHTITFHIEHASFPNEDGTTQVRPYQMSGSELSWKVAPRPDGSVPVTVLRRFP